MSNASADTVDFSSLRPLPVHWGELDASELAFPGASAGKSVADGHRSQVCVPILDVFDPETRCGAKQDAAQLQKLSNLLRRECGESNSRLSGESVEAVPNPQLEVVTF